MEPILSISLAILGMILIIVFIILGIKLIEMVNRMNRLLDNVEDKVNSLNGFFHIVDMATDKMAFLSDHVVSVVTGAIHKIFKRKKKEEEDYE